MLILKCINQCFRAQRGVFSSVWKLWNIFLLTMHVVTLDGENISLTKKEFDILKLLMENPNRVFSPKEIYREVWHEDPMGADNTVAVHIRHLREKTEINPAEPRYIKVVFGQGYKIQKGN